MTFAGKVFFTSVALLINMHANKLEEQDKLKAFPVDSEDLGMPFKERFDFIIVGAGTSGCILARRLVDANFKVLLLEAGGNPPPLLDVQFVNSFIQNHSNSDLNVIFQQVSVQKITAGLPKYNNLTYNSQLAKILTGKTMGGSTSINEMQYERGSPQSYDQWAKIAGDRTWKYEQILQYFEKMEEYLGISVKEGNDGMDDGTLNLTLGQEIWFNAGRELGFNIFNSSEPQRVGFNPLRFIQKNGMRINTYAAFLKTIEETRKPFLEIRRYSIVSKVLFEGKRATGVYYTRHGIPRVASAMKEVIMCAGTFKTPILLMKSGIGSENQLRAANVDPIIANLPEVGRNLQDHPIVQIGPIGFDDNITLWNPQQNFTFEDVEQFFKFKKGPLTNPYELKFGEAIVASNGVAREVGPDWPDLQISFDSGKCTIRLIRSHSQGLLKFNSSATGIEDPFFLTAEFKFFKVDRDIDAMIQGIDFCLKVVESTESFQKLGAKYVRQSIPECDHEEFRSKEYWTCYVKHTAGLSYSAVGTCRMGKKYELDPPRSSVVDHKLRVHDVDNLRVVDASVMPTIPNANVAAATMMIAEKCSDIIIKHYCGKNSKLCETKNKS